MIVVRVELHSARTGEVTELARMHLANDAGQVTAKRADYDGKTFVGRSTEGLYRGEVSHTGRVENWPRLDLHIWNLVQAMLTDMGYTKGPRLKAEPQLALGDIGNG